MNQLILTPLTHTTSTHFLTKLERRGVYSYEPATRKTFELLFDLLKIVTSMSFAAVIFGIPYSFLLMRIYGGNEIILNNGHHMLKLHYVILLLSAVKGITESFVFAAMNLHEVIYLFFMLDHNVITDSITFFVFVQTLLRTICLPHCGFTHLWNLWLYYSKLHLFSC